MHTLCARSAKRLNNVKQLQRSRPGTEYRTEGTQVDRPVDPAEENACRECTKQREAGDKPKTVKDILFAHEIPVSMTHGRGDTAVRFLFIRVVILTQEQSLTTKNHVR